MNFTIQSAAMKNFVNSCDVRVSCDLSHGIRRYER